MNGERSLQRRVMLALVLVCLLTLSTTVAGNASVDSKLTGFIPTSIHDIPLETHDNEVEGQISSDDIRGGELWTSTSDDASKNVTAIQSYRSGLSVPVPVADIARDLTAHTVVRSLAAKKASMKSVKKASKRVTKIAKEKMSTYMQSGGERPVRFTAQPKECKVTPSFNKVQPNTEFTVECPAVRGLDSGDRQVVLDFTSDPSGELKEDSLADLCEEMSGSVVSQLELVMPPLSSVSKRLVVCDEDAVTPVAYTVVVRSRASEDTPLLSYFGASQTADSIRDLDLTKQTQNITLYANEPMVIAARVDVGAFVSSEEMTVHRAVNGYVLMDYTPKIREGESTTVSVFVTNSDKSVFGNYTLAVNAVRSINPKLATVAISPGRLEPVFSPTTYTYFARVPSGTSSISVDFSAVNDRDTVCKLNDGSEQIGKGSAVVYTGNNFLNENLDIVTIDCVADDPSHEVRYVLTIVQQAGGSTLLNSLDVVGAEITPQFTPNWGGPYTADFGLQKVNNLKWVAFDIRPVNNRAIVKVDGQEVNLRHNVTPYYRVPIGERRRFRITIRTKQNPVEEEYLVDINRPAAGPQAWMRGSRFGNILGWTSYAVAASSGALSFVSNAKLLQYLSLTHWLNGNPEVYDAFSAEMNKFNLIYRYNPQDLYVKDYPTGVDTVSDVAFNSSMSDQSYNEFLKNFQVTSRDVRHDELLDSMTGKVASYMQLSVFDNGSKDKTGAVVDGSGGWVDAYRNDPSVRTALKRVVQRQFKDAVHSAHADDMLSWSLFNINGSTDDNSTAITTGGGNTAGTVIVSRRLGELLDDPARMLLPMYSALI
eukprot:Lankesteria_metandrocarpae@DN3627_c0_g1_i1.p1